MRVLKFNGVSIANAQNIRLALKLILEKSKEFKTVVVVAAFDQVTNLLVEASLLASSNNDGYKAIVLEIEKRHLAVVKELISVHEQSAILSHCKRIINHLETLLDGCYLLSEFSSRTSDTILGFGELLSAYIIAEVLKREQASTTYKDSRELIKTDNHFGRAAVNFELTNPLIHYYFAGNDSQVTVMPGFIASSIDDYNTTLGRGGSDYTAAIVVAALEVPILEIWTDFGGMFTANPQLVQQAQLIEHISYQEAMELLHFGAKELYPPSIQPLLNKQIPIIIKNIFAPGDKGTYISGEVRNTNGPVKGISHINQIALLTVEGSGMIGVSGSSKRIFDVLSNEAVNVIFITQASSEHSICIGMLNADVERATAAIDNAFALEIVQKKINPCVVEKNLCIVALVGEHMKNHQGISGKMFSTLGRNNVNIRAIAQGASERNISVVINERDIKKALNSLHESFFEENVKQLNLFVMGAGNVGEIFIDQLHRQQQFLLDNLKLNVRVIALSSSSKMYFAEDGVELTDWKALLSTGEVADTTRFINKVKQLNKRNSIFVDITANEKIAYTYDEYLKSNIAVVTCNKIACSSSFNNYNMLKKLSHKYNAPFLFETNVGAGLPIIDTLKNLIASGDNVHKIQAVLSGSLNFIFNNFNEQTTFLDVVKQAEVEGYTEPDPKIDLSGVDVMRKLLILVRESGYRMEAEEIRNESFLPRECLDTTTVASFYESLEKHAAHFKALYQSAIDNNCRLKYVAQFEEGKASVGLQQIPKDHPFYNLEGKDNIVLFFTDRYVDQPLLIKGAGAGTAVTASGIFADVIRISTRN